MLPYFYKVFFSSVILVCFITVSVLADNSEQQKDTDVGEITIPLQSFKSVFDSLLRPSYSMDESRGWKKMAMPFLLGVTLKMTTLIPMVTSLMTIIGGVALLSSKLALLISLGLALHYYIIAKQHQLHSQAHLQGLAYDHGAHPASAYPLPVTHRFSVQA
ncbi:uncharacterized protein LOC111043591 [Nilaparvata lugens]|uniref:uncharacterized protein LOC111043591 n=1 Tax=Nilaparvata lugens TaxID=108931 RepID=UPI00193E0635|nr:uncharacterized protein LOC111043591 [Nilaparvata lugens]